MMSITKKILIPSIQRFKEHSSRSNLAQVVHSSWVSTKGTHLPIYECTLDNVAEFVTTKQIVKGYEEGNFSCGTGLSYMQIS